MAKQNCWEFKKCGREIGGSKADELGVCPAATNEQADGFCGGKNGGRACVYITGTLCDGTFQKTYKSKEKVCFDCEFHAELKKEHPKEMTIFSYLDYMVKRGEETKKYKEIKN